MSFHSFIVYVLLNDVGLGKPWCIMLSFWITFFCFWAIDHSNIIFTSVNLVHNAPVE